MTTRLGTVSKIFFLFGLATFLFFGSFGLLYSMDANGQMTMPTCPFMVGQTGICKMNPLQHLSAWKNMFVVSPVKNILTAFIALLLFLGSQLLRKTSEVSALWESIQYNNSTFARSFQIPNLLQESFSQGILHPKTF